MTALLKNARPGRFRPLRHHRLRGGQSAAQVQELHRQGQSEPGVELRDPGPRGGHRHRVRHQHQAVRQG